MSMRMVMNVKVNVKVTRVGPMNKVTTNVCVVMCGRNVYQSRDKGCVIGVCQERLSLAGDASTVFTTKALHHPW